MVKVMFKNIKQLLVSKFQGHDCDCVGYKLKLTVINCYIYSFFLYDDETWKMNKHCESKIKTFKIWYIQIRGMS